MNPLFIYFIEAIIAFGITFYIINKYIPGALRKELIGIDVHKVDKPKVANYGGFAIVIGFLFGLGFAFPFVNQTTRLLLLIPAFAIVLAGFVGLIDDLIELSIVKKIILSFICAIPLVITKVGLTVINLPFLGHVDLGIFYVILFVPIYFAILVNMTNMLAGYNGLEVGMGIITTSALAIIFLIQGNTNMLILLIPYIATLLAFYIFNRYPAKVFIGDVGTLTIGAILASAAIIGNAESVVLFLCIPYIVHFALYAIYTFIFIQKYGDPKISSVDKNGILTPMYFDKDKKQKAWHKLYFLIEHWFYPLTEQKLVNIFLTTQFILNLVVILIYALF